MNKKLAASLLLPALTAGSMLVASPSAHAALPSDTVRRANTSGMTCSGKVLTRKSAYVNGKTVGVITLYINNNNRGTVYGCFAHAGITMRRAYPTAITLAGFNSRYSTKPVVMVTKAVNTKTAAGVVAINHVKVLTHCVEGVGAIAIGGKNHRVYTDRFCYVRVVR